MVDLLSGLGAAWHLADIEVEETSSGQKFMFACNRWLSKSEDDKQICRELTCANLQTPRSSDKLCKLTVTACAATVREPNSRT